MDKLRKKIICYFALCVVSYSLVETVLDPLQEVTVERIILPRVIEDGNVTPLILATCLSAALSLLLLFITAVIFYRLVKKAVEEESQRRTAEQNMLYACIAHDLKTPMTSVQGFAAALRDGRVKEEERGEICDIICLKTRHMNELVDTLSAYSKLGTEDFSLNLGETNLCTLVRDTAAMNYSDFESKGTEMIIDIPEEPIICTLDRKEFTRAVNNVIVNACKHNPGGCRVLIKVHTDGGQAYITVADTGEAIPDELVPSLFDPFVCGSASRTSGTGSGLGLAVSARIAEKHGAKLFYSTDIEGYSKGFVFEVGR